MLNLHMRDIICSSRFIDMMDGWNTGDFIFFAVFSMHSVVSFTGGGVNLSGQNSALFKIVVPIVIRSYLL